MKVKYKRKKYEVKAVTPSDFLETSGIPFGLFSTNEVQSTIYGSISNSLKTDDELIADHKKAQEVMKIVLKAGLVTKVDLDRVIQDDQLALFLYTCIIAETVNTIEKIFDVNRDYATSIDLICSRYGQRPSDLVIPDGNATEKLSFDTFICSVGRDNEIKMIKEQKRKAKKGLK